MPEEVIEAQVDESPAPPTTPDPAAEITTLNKRLSGKDAALTKAIQERESFKAEATRLQQWKLEQEQANLSETQRLQQERDQAKADAAQARAEAKAARLARDYPLAADALGDALGLADETRLAEIEARLKATPATEEPAPRVDANSPRRTPPTAPSGPLTSAQISELISRSPEDSWKQRG